MLVAATAPGKYVVLASNFGHASPRVAVQLGGCTPLATLPVPSFRALQVSDYTLPRRCASQVGFALALRTAAE